PGCRGCWARPGRRSGSPTPEARTRWRSPAWTALPWTAPARQKAGIASPFGWPKASWATSPAWPLPRTGLRSRPPRPTAGFCSSTGGARAAPAAHDGRLLLVDVASGQVTELATADDGAVYGLSWSPDSAWLAW